MIGQHVETEPSLEKHWKIVIPKHGYKLLLRGTTIKMPKDGKSKLVVILVFQLFCEKMII